MEKTKVIDLEKGETFSFLGFDYRLVKHKEKKMVLIRAIRKKVQELLEKVRILLKRNRDKSFWEVIPKLNEIVRGWINYFRIGHCSRLFNFIKQWVEKKIRRFVRKAQGRKGFGWKEWSSQIIYDIWGLYNDYQIRYYEAKAKPVR